MLQIRTEMHPFSVSGVFQQLGLGSKEPVSAELLYSLLLLLLLLLRRRRRQRHV